VRDRLDIGAACLGHRQSARCEDLPVEKKPGQPEAVFELVSLLTFALILGAVALGLASPPGTGAVAEREDITSLCPLMQVALDRPSSAAGPTCRSGLTFRLYPMYEKGRYHA
jgi:hypothetical protein